MSLARHAKRRDANAAPILDALERVGAEVWVTDRPADALVWYGRRWHVIEIKTAQGRYTARQKADRAQGLCEGIVTVRTPLDALQAIGAVSAGEGA